MQVILMIIMWVSLRAAKREVSPSPIYFKMDTTCSIFLKYIHNKTEYNFQCVISSNLHITFSLIVLCLFLIINVFFLYLILFFSVKEVASRFMQPAGSTATAPAKREGTFSPPSLSASLPLLSPPLLTSLSRLLLPFVPPFPLLSFLLYFPLPSPLSLLW